MTFPDAMSILVQTRAVLGLGDAEDLPGEARRLVQENARLKALLDEHRPEHPSTCALWPGTKSGVLCNCGAAQANAEIDAALKRAKP